MIPASQTMNETLIVYHEWNPHKLPWMKPPSHTMNETLIIYREWNTQYISLMKPSLYIMNENSSHTMNKTLIIYREWNPHHIPWLKPSPHTMPPNDVVVASCDVNEAAAAEVAWSRGGPGSRAPGVFESRRCYFVPYPHTFHPSQSYCAIPPYFPSLTIILL